MIQDPNAGGYAERKRIRAKGGKPDGKTAKKLKLIGAHLQTQIDRWQGVDANGLWADGAPWPGWFPLDATVGDQVDNGYLPYYIWDLTGAYKNKTTSANGTFYVNAFSSPCQRLRRSSGNAGIDAGTYYFGAIPGRDNEDVGDTFMWLPERTPDTLQPNPTLPPYRQRYTTKRTGDKCYFDWVDCRFKLYGASKAPTRVHVRIIQFTEEDMTPGTQGVYLTNPANPTTEVKVQNVFVDQEDASTDKTDDRQRFNRWQNFWMSETDRCVGNAIQIRGIQTQRPYRLLHSKTFDFQPTSNDENDPTPHSIEYQLKYDLTKVVDYVQNPDTSDFTYDEVGKPNEWIQSGGGHQSISCNAKGRVYLVVHAEVPQVTANNPEGSRIGDYAPSFDIILRRKHHVLALG